MNSIYHFFKNLVDNKHYFLQVKKLEEFPYDSKLFSCKNIGTFPDMAIRINAKVCLVHGSFFETIQVDELIAQSFSQVLEERLKERGEHFSDEMKNRLLS